MALSHKENKLVKETLCCGICFENYNSSNHLPKALPCLHSFCLECFQALKIDSETCKISCPICSSITTVPEGDAKNLPTNLALSELLDAVDHEEMLACGKHADQKVIVICMDCYEGLCIMCVKSLSKGTHHNHTLEDAQASLKAIKSNTQEEIKYATQKWTDYRNTGVQMIGNDTWQIRQSINHITEEVVQLVLDWKEKKLLELDNTKAEKLQQIFAKVDEALKTEEEKEDCLKRFQKNEASLCELLQMKQKEPVKPQTPKIESMSVSKEKLGVSYADLVDTICRSSAMRDEMSQTISSNFPNVRTSTPKQTPAKRYTASSNRNRKFDFSPRFQQRRFDCDSSHSTGYYSETDKYEKRYRGANVESRGIKKDLKLKKRESNIESWEVKENVNSENRQPNVERISEENWDEEIERIENAERRKPPRVDRNSVYKMINNILTSEDATSKFKKPCDSGSRYTLPDGFFSEGNKKSSF